MRQARKPSTSTTARAARSASGNGRTRRRSSWASALFKSGAGFFGGGAGLVEFPFAHDLLFVQCLRILSFTLGLGKLHGEPVDLGLGRPDVRVPEPRRERRDGFGGDRDLLPNGAYRSNTPSISSHGFVLRTSSGSSQPRRAWSTP